MFTPLRSGRSNFNVRIEFVTDDVPPGAWHLSENKFRGSADAHT
jgi:hypothetical protein